MSVEQTGIFLPGEQPCQYAGARLQFRGPERDLNRPYLVFLGAGETFGRYVARPFPARVEEALGQPCINLGAVNAGIDAFLSEPDLLDIAARADMAVVQLFGAQNLSNRFYRVHPRRNDRFLTATDALTALYPEVDFTAFHFNRHMLMALHRAGPNRFAMLRTELQRAWKSRTARMLRRLRGNALLLHLQYSPDAGSEPDRRLGPEPLMVDAPLLADVSPLAQAAVSLPVTRAGQEGGLEGMVFPQMQLPSAAHQLGPDMHAVIAAKVTQTLRRLRGTRKKAR